MDPERRTRAATGLTLILLSGLGLLVFARSRSPEASLPIRFAYTPPTQPAEAAPVRLFEAPTAEPDSPEEGEAPAAEVSALYLIYIPRLDLYAPIIPIDNELQQIGGEAVWQLSLPPEHAVGWSTLSAPIGQPGNTVLVGHNNEYGEVFRDLETLAEGDEVYVRAEAGDRRYRVSETALFEEEYRPLAERLANARWIAPTPDERLTLVSCWPYVSNTHRVVVVARPD